MTDSMRVIRKSLASLDLTHTSHQAVDAPDPARIYAPDKHGLALDPARTLVVGNRGVGKSFWAAVLAHESARSHVSSYFPRLSLKSLDVALGFHEAAGMRDDIAPSPTELNYLLTSGFTPEQIWSGVLVRALGNYIPSLKFDDLQQAVKWTRDEALQFEKVLREVDEHFATRGRKFLLVFDALDRLGRDWSIIRTLTHGILRVALQMRGYRALRAKIFMRTDQAADESIYAFPDASKLRAERVDLIWQRSDLYGLLFAMLWTNLDARTALLELANEAGLPLEQSTSLPESLRHSEELQARLFYIMAGEFMGGGKNRGRTYTWLHGHLADAFEQTSPRSFLTAIQRAAEQDPDPIRTAIDHIGLQAGVQAASETRVTQLREDYDWIGIALADLEGLEVPCEASRFRSRWKERLTVDRIRHIVADSAKLGPIELENDPIDREAALLQALRTIGVVERRSEDRINMPDLFRVEAKIKRRGGVKPPARPR